MKTVGINIAKIILLLFLSLLLASCGAPATEDVQQAAAEPSVSVTATPAPTPTMMPTNTVAPSPSAVPTIAPTPTASITHDHSSMAHASTAPMGAEVRADIKLFMYKPEPIEVAAGTTVVWTNQDDIEHSVTSGSPDATTNVFDSGLFAKDKSFAFTFSTPGEFAYFCTRHNSMGGTVKVTSSAVNAAPPARLVIPAIGLDVKPATVGLDEQGVPVVPRHDVGWYSGSSMPGNTSNVIFWGHVLRWQDTPSVAAPFERLHELPVGAELVITSTDQRERRYRVTEHIRVRPENVVYLLPTSEERITLVSCIGDNVMVSGTLTKEYRLVTIAEPLV
jgi:plastocyanin/sortase (surface protein transpeptidase)